MKTRLKRLFLGLSSTFALSTVLSAPAIPLQLVSSRDSSQSPPAGGAGDSWGPVLSPDGRFVLFTSTANNLTLTSQSNPLPILVSPKLNVFLRDRASGTTTLVSVSATGTGGGNGDSFPTAISTNGRFACFESLASDLVPGDTNGVGDVFVRDLASNVTVLVSASLYGGSGNGACRGSTMTPDGRYVAFVSAATNLVAGDTNGIADVFVRDMQAGLTTLASVGARTTNSISVNSSESPDISDDGRFIAFWSSATNLVSGATNGSDIYIRDTVAGTTIWASVNARTFLGKPYAFCGNHAMSADGKFVAYEANTNAPLTGETRGLILRFSLDSGLTDLVHTNAYAPTGAAEDVRSLEISTDGRFIAFVANTNGASGATTCIYLWDAQSGVATLVSGDLNGNVQPNSVCAWPAVDPAGNFVAFLSSATNLVTNAIPGDYHLYVRNLQTATTALVDADTNCVGSSVGPMTAPLMSADGRFVAFESPDANLVANDRNHDYDVFLRDLVAATNGLISARHPALPAVSPNGPTVLSSFSLSSNGRYIAFSSDADNLVANDNNGFRDVFVRDMFFSTNALVSVGTNGVAADGISFEPAISATGRYIVFTSWADNLTPGDANRQTDVFLRDLQAGTTTLVSIKTNGAGSGNNASYSPIISTDGMWVLFRSQATDLAFGLSGSSTNLFLRNLPAGITYALTTSGVTAAAATPDLRFIAFGGQSGNLYLWDSQATAITFTNTSNPVLAVAISPAADRIVYNRSNQLYSIDRTANTNGLIGPVASGARAGLRFSGDGRFLTYARLSGSTNQVYLYYFQSGNNLLVSQASGLGPASGASDSPDISADGHFVAYRSFATNLVLTANSNSAPNLFLYDESTGATSLLTASRYGGTGDNRSAWPQFSPDGRTLVFQSAVSDLAANDFNHSGDIFAFSFLYASVTLGSAGQGPTLAWPARPGETYSVQFKDNLSDANWQNVNGNVTVVGNQAQLTDLASGSGQRFYRVVGF